jgi:hypothetical protein
LESAMKTITPKLCKHGLPKSFCEVCLLKKEIRRLEIEVFEWQEECSNLTTILTTRPLPDGVTPEDMQLRNQILEHRVQELEYQLHKLRGDIP